MKNYMMYMLTILLLSAQACNEAVVPTETKQDIPIVFPDYAGVTIPASIAPLNFSVQDEFSRIDAVFEGSETGIIHIQNKEAIEIPEKEWKGLLEKNTGGSLKVTVSLKKEKGWIQYAPFSIYISPYPIDYGLVYRLIAPGYEVYSKMGIYQRTLSDFTQTTLIENTILPASCVNCHSFNQNNPKYMNLHIRGEFGATMLSVNGNTELYTTKTEETLSNCVYPYWHPSGKYIAYSVNKTQQGFHEIKNKRIEVVDLASDLVVYDIEKNQLFSSPLLKNDSVFETFPAFSPDGKSLYFCSADYKTLPLEYDQIKYSLCRIDFNPEAGGFGQVVDTLVSASTTNKSVSFPRPSFDGRYLMYTLSDYGNFSIWHKEADLWLVDLQTGTTRELTEVNSNDVESYHNWSSNSRWFVFSSRRLDGLYTRPFIASIDEQGNVSKPFLLPQKKVSHYDNLLQSFNIPEFVTSPVSFDIRTVEKKALKKERTPFEFRKN
ncbi:hypothetical protein [Massilibacteroides sp.]|uniref:TolB family protein n=1 Tax=Massilibacteroides sp. TaxID=2034766 RepID=UPI00262D8BDD|nr:hypothetical protein [Massilibacteroides sp.]MDD4514123.1 hypothetical protein [Massilibacteroides sp.]